MLFLILAHWSIVCKLDVMIVRGRWSQRSQLVSTEKLAKLVHVFFAI